MDEYQHADTPRARSTRSLAAGLRHRGQLVDVIGLELSNGSRRRFPKAAATLVRSALRDGAYDVLDAPAGVLWRVTARERRSAATALFCRATNDARSLSWWARQCRTRTVLLAHAVLVLDEVRREELEENGSAAHGRVVVTAPVAGNRFRVSQELAESGVSFVIFETDASADASASDVALVKDVLERWPESTVTWVGRGLDDVTRAVNDPWAMVRLRVEPNVTDELFSQLCADAPVIIALGTIDPEDTTLLEAMSYGAVVVSSPGRDGAVVTVGETTVETQLAFEQLRDPESLRALRTASRAFATRRAPGRVVDVLLENYFEGVRTVRQIQLARESKVVDV